MEVNSTTLFELFCWCDCSLIIKILIDWEVKIQKSSLNIQTKYLKNSQIFRRTTTTIYRSFRKWATSLFLRASPSRNNNKWSIVIPFLRNWNIPVLNPFTPYVSNLSNKESEITSSLFFQQLLYFNSFYLGIFVLLYLASQAQRFMYFTFEYGVPVRIIVFVIFVAMDICRLQNGFYGNLKESVILYWNSSLKFVPF